MSGKSSVSALQEYCQKNKIPAPIYDFIDSDDGSFICKAIVMDIEAYGNGRSKRDAKHLSAANVIKKVRLVHPDIDEIPQLTSEEIPTTDMIMMLRDYCVQHNHPLPTIDIVQQAGTPDAPEFIALCTVATIQRYGVSEKKKDARQKAAYEMLRVIYDEQDTLEHHMQVATVDAKADDVETERYSKFKTYRELTESKSGEVPGIRLCDRHNYFVRFFKELKKAAQNVLTASYESEEEQAKDLFTALKITPKVKPMEAAKSMERMLLIELNCEYDVVFAGFKSQVYGDILNYFKGMLL